MLTLPQIYSQFKTLTTSQQKIDYLYQLQSYNLPYYINYNNLINYYLTH